MEMPYSNCQGACAETGLPIE
ncbi:Protein of unknown function [Gryllus bimaculatus]|nr:Protein of unknown function [Gryllus bimaculatus]